MAIIGRIRKHSGLAVILVGVAIAAFVIGDFSKRNNGRTTELGDVNGEAIPYVEFSNKVDEALTAQKEANGNDRISDEETYSIRTNTWNKLVRDIIMEKERDELGLTVTEDELFDQIQGKNPHRYILQYFKNQQTGMYDQGMIQNYLRNLDKLEPKAKDQWFRFEQAIKDDRLDTKFNNLISKAYYVPKAFAARVSADQNKKLSIRLIAPVLTSISDSSVQLTDADFQAYYDKNKQFFYQDEATRDADYVLFEVVPSDQDRKLTAENVTALYTDMQASQDIVNFINANSDVKYDSTFKKKGTLPGQIDSLAFKSPAGTLIAPFELNNTWYMAKTMAVQERPDTMKGAQLLISFAGSPLQNQNIKRTKEEAKKLADSLATVIRKDYAKFKEYAIKYSDYPTAKDDGGKLDNILDGDPNFGIFFKEGMVMKQNDVKVIENALGYSVFYLSYKSKNIPKASVAVFQRSIEPSNQTFQDTYLKASAFAGQNRTPEAFEKAATAQGLQKRSAMGIKQMDNFMMGLPSAREVVRWAYNEETKVGDVSQVFDLNGKYVVAVLKSTTEKGIVPLDKMKDRIEMAVRSDKKITIIADKLAQAAKTTQDINALAAQFNTKVDTTMITFSGFNQNVIGRENEVLGTLFTKERGSFNAPLKGRFGVYAVVIDEIVEAPIKQDYTQEAAQMAGSFMNRVPQSLFEAMKKNAEIKDNRMLFY